MLGAEIDCELPILGHSALGDVHTSEHFHARHHLKRDVVSDRALLDQPPVYPNSHLHQLGLGLEMNVAGANLKCLSDEVIQDNNGIGPFDDVFGSAARGSR